jgi:hypothetical protein
MANVKEHFDTCEMESHCYEHPFECVGRAPLRVGNFDLSIQANCRVYCTPRYHVGKEPADFYDAVEIAVWPAATARAWGVWSTPKNTPALEQFAQVWNGQDVAGWVSWEDVQRVADALEAAQ